MRTKIRTGMINREFVERAITNVEAVLRQVVQNCAKNVSNAQAMKGNASALYEDLVALHVILDDLVANEAADIKAAEKVVSQELKAAKEAEAVAEAEETKESKPRGRPAKVVTEVTETSDSADEA